MPGHEGAEVALLEALVQTNYPSRPCSGPLPTLVTLALRPGSSHRKELLLCAEDSATNENAPICPVVQLPFQTRDVGEQKCISTPLEGRYHRTEQSARHRHHGPHCTAVPLPRWGVGTR